MVSNHKKNKKPAAAREEMEKFDPEAPENDTVFEPEALAEGEQEADRNRGDNFFLRRLMDTNFIEYASYVIKERAIPDVDDGLKPVQRRILWSLHRMDDGKFHKAANVIGHTMQFHPHGDASIGDALVVLANKEYFIDKQGNFGNIFTGDRAAAARYIECRLSPLGREVLFNNDITEFVPSYDGRNQEPVTLPVKIPSLLMLGSDGIAVGMSTRIMPHNFNELLEAQIACLRGEEFELYPDFQTGGLMDVSKYEGGNGKITLRAKIEIDGRRLVVREIPAFTNSEHLIGTIEAAAEKGKLKLTSIHDYTTDRIEIEIVPMRGYDPEKALQALYTYTECEMAVNVNMMVICENRPVQMSVPEVLRRNTARLLDYLKRELDLELGKQEELLHGKTLARIFIENRIYKRIEKCETQEAVMAEIRKGLLPFRKELLRDVTDDDIEKLLALPIRRISTFDIRKNQEEIEAIRDIIAQVKKNLAHLKKYAIDYLKALLAKYGKAFPRKTEIETFEKIDRHAVALNNIKVGWDRGESYIGTAVKSDDMITCNEFDHLLCVDRSGTYKIINIPEKLFIGKLCDFRKYDKGVEFGVIYSDKKSGKSYIKRCYIAKFITEREYQLCPDGCKLELFTPRTDAVYELQFDTRFKDKKLREINLMEAPLRGAKARGVLLDSKKLLKVTHIRWLEQEEIEAAKLVADGVEPDPDDNHEDDDDDNDSAAPVISVASESEPPQPSRRKKAAETEDTPLLPELAPPREDEPAKPSTERGRKRRQDDESPTAGSDKKRRKAKDRKDNDDDDDLGIEQPTLGF